MCHIFIFTVLEKKHNDITNKTTQTLNIHDDIDEEANMKTENMKLVCSHYAQAMAQAVKLNAKV